MRTSAAIFLATIMVIGPAHAQAPATSGNGASDAQDPAATLVSRLDLEQYKATIKGLTAFGDREQVCTALRPKAQHYQARESLRGILTDVGKTEVAGYERAFLCLAELGQLHVAGAGGLLVPDGDGIVSVATQEGRHVRVHVLVGPEAHQATSAENGTIRSLANSAAYSRAACTSSSVMW